jgi:hypothetical protein
MLPPFEVNLEPLCVHTREKMVGFLYMICNHVLFNHLISNVLGENSPSLDYQKLLEDAYRNLEC